jgi:hypothetical protein
LKKCLGDAKNAASYPLSFNHDLRSLYNWKIAPTSENSKVVE